MKHNRHASVEDLLLTALGVGILGHAVLLSLGLARLPSAQNGRIRGRREDDDR